MKKEAVSVLKPRNGKPVKAKGKVGKVSKKNESKISSPVGKEEPRGKQKAQIVAVQQVNIDSNALKKLTNRRIGKDDENTQNHVKIDNESNAKKSEKHAAAKMAAMRKNADESARGQPKRLKPQVGASVVSAKKPKIVQIVSLKKSPKVEAELETADTTKPKNKKSQITKKINIENVGDLKLTKSRVLQTVKAARKLSEKQNESKKSLLPIENNPLLLQVTCVKIAKTPRRQIRPFLPHQMAGPLDDVALFVPDLEKGRGRDYEKTVDHWETILREKGVTCIKEIIPINRVKTEYSQLEMKRKLAMSFDYFLADGRIIRHLTHLLGKSFFKRRAAPTPVKLRHDNLKAEFAAALRKTCMEIHSYGNTHSMQVGTFALDEKKLAENVWAACETIAKEYPGGWANIRALHLKTQTGPGIPIYMNFVSKNNVPTPVVEPKRPRAYETVEGELTTVPGGAKVKLTPEGKISVKRLKDFADPEEAEEDEDDEDEEEEEEETKAIKEESEGEKDDSDED